jgi:peptide/nickel transport system substrate-binding protein
MSKKKMSLFLLLMLSLVLTLAFTACARDEDEGGGAGGGDSPLAGIDIADPEDPHEDAGGLVIDEDIIEELTDDHPLYAMIALQERFPAVATSSGTPIDGGHLVVAIPSDTPFPGVLNQVFWAEARDSDIMSWFEGGSVFSSRPNRTWGQYGIVTWVHDIAERSITLTQVEDVYWHDGAPLTLDDLVFAFEVIASPGYAAAGGIRWGAAIQRVQGVMEFHNGEVDHISGLVLSNDNRTLKMYFNDFPPSVLHFGVWSTPMPRHIFGDVPIEDIPNHHHTRVQPIGFGPFIVENITPGENVFLRANENFWLGRPYLDTVELNIVATEMVASLMLEGAFDIVLTWRLSDITDIPNPTNFMYVAEVGNTFGVFAFNLGYYDEDTNQIVTFDDPRMGDVRLRRAMAYAIDVQSVATYVFEGFRFPATSVIPPGHAAFLDTDLRGFPYNPGRAMELLDEAGFLMGADGFRTDQEGNPFVISFYVGINPQNEMLAMFYQQNWADVGLNVDVRMADFGAYMAPNQFFYVGVRSPFDITFLNWTAGFDPNPNTLWGHSTNNIPRFMNPEFEAVLDGFNSDAAWDSAWLTNQYHVWQSLFNEYVPAIITDWRLNFAAANNRVHNFAPYHFAEDGLRTHGGWHRIQLTSPTRYSA